MSNQLISGARIRVTIGNQVFEIPQEKAQQLINILQSWQSVSIPENQTNPYLNYQGKSLVFG